QISEIKNGIDNMINDRKLAKDIMNMREKSAFYEHIKETYFNTIRYHVDKLESLIDDEIWTLPKYRELLLMC
ncbi:MAG: hypothetical protein ORN85_06355, partial [Sediminibacterium sp.]|nr:hypothetical protein [Sediminibacterium sp.]